MPRFEHINPVAGLVMIVVGLIILTLGYPLPALPPIVVGVFLVAFYRRFLLQLLGV